MTPITVQAPLQETARSKTADAAQSLADFAGAGAEFLGNRQIRKEREGFEQAAKDFSSGIFDEEQHQRNKGYMTGRERLRARADAVTMLPEIKDEMRKMDLDSMTEEEVSAAFNALVRAKFNPDGEADEAEQVYLLELADFILAAEIEIIGDHKVNALAEARSAERTDLVNNIRGQYADPDGGIDYKFLHDEVDRMQDGPKRNDLYFNTLALVAREFGDSEVMKNMPSNYPDGTPSIKHNPDWDERINSVIAQADAIKVQMLAATEKVRKAYVSDVTRQVYIDQANGNPVAFEDVTTDVLVSSQFTGTEMASFISSATSINAEQFKRGGDTVQQARLTADMALDPRNVTVQELWKAYQEGVFGDPDSVEAGARHEQMQDTLKQYRRDHDAVMSNPIAKARLAELVLITQPELDLLGNKQSQHVELSASIRRKFSEGIAGGKEPIALSEELKVEYAVRKTAITELIHMRTPMSAATLLANEQIDAADYVAAHHANGWSYEDIPPSLERENPRAYRAILMLLPQKP